MVKNFSRRFMACLLSMALIVTYAIPISVYADVEPAEKGTTEIESAGGTLYFNEGGSWVNEEDDWAVKTTATAKEVAGAADTYDITLQVESKLAAASNEKAAIVLALDMSKSVNAENIKNEALTFIESLIDGAGNASRKVAIVEFASNVRTITPFIEANNKKLNPYGKKGVSQGVIDAINAATQNFSTEISFIETRNNPKNGNREWRCTHGRCGGKNAAWRNWNQKNSEKKENGHTHAIAGGPCSNIDGAMMMARNLLNAGLGNKGDIDGYKGSVVVITDGLTSNSSYCYAYDNGLFDYNNGRITDGIDWNSLYGGETVYMYGDKYDGLATDSLCEPEDYRYFATVASQIAATGSDLYFALPSDFGEEKFNTWLYKNSDAWINEKKEYDLEAGKEAARDAYANVLSSILGDNLFITRPRESFGSKLDQIRVAIEQNLTVSNMTVSIPMGDFIKFESCGDAGVTCPAGNMVWKPANGETANGVKKYTVTYRVKADTTTDAFAKAAGADGVVHFTAEKLDDNGWSLTTLRNDKGDLLARFDMPTFKGTVPEVNYSIEYYKYEPVQDEDGNWVAGKAVLQEGDSVNGKDKIHTFIGVDNYATKYASDNYELAAEPEGLEKEDEFSQTSGLRLKPNADNALKLYYTPKAAGVKINYTYRTIHTYEDGTTEPVTFGPISDDKNGTKYVVGTTFKANAATYLDKDEIRYELVAAESDNTTITVNEDADKNVINLVFEGKVDHRDKANFKIYRRIDEGEWGLVNGRWEVVYNTPGAINWAAPWMQNGADEDWRVGMSVPIDIYDGLDEGITYVDNDMGIKPTGENNDKMSLLLTAKAKDANGEEQFNSLTLIYHKAPADTRKAATITVNHVYTYVKTTVNENGGVDTETLVDHVEVPETVTGWYVGETFTPTKQLVYGGKTYVNNETLESRTLGDGENTFTIEYGLIEVPDSATVTVIHHYMDEQTVYEDGEATGLAWTENTGLAKSETVSQIAVPDGRDFITRDIYVGELFKALPIEQPENAEGYDVRRDENKNLLGPDGEIVPNSMILTSNAEKNVIDIYYFKEVAAGSSITVQHKYITYKDIIDTNGKLLKDQPQEAVYGEEVTLDGKTGAGYEIKPIVEFNNVKYELVEADKAKLTGKFKKVGGNGTVELTYVRHIGDKDLTPGFLKVAFRLIERKQVLKNNELTTEYYTFTKEENGSRHYADEMVFSPLITQDGIKVFAPGETTAEAIPSKVYVGQKFTLDLPQTVTESEMIEDGSDAVYTKEDGSAEVTVGAKILPIRRAALDGLVVEGDAPIDRPIVVELTTANVITYGRTIELAKNDINVVRVVTTLTSDDEGNPASSTTSAAVKAGTVYEGQYLELSTAGLEANQTFTGLTVENATASAIVDGNTNVTITDISKAATVTLNYTVDLSKHARGTVTHNFIRHDLDGKVEDVVETKEVKIDRYAGQSYTATDERYGSFTDRVEVVGGSWTIKLHEGDDNNLTINYYDDYESLTGAKVLVNHVYFKTDASGLLTTHTAIEMTKPQVLVKKDGAWVGNTAFSVTPVIEPNEYKYELVDEFTVEGADGKVTTYTTDAYENLTVPETAECAITDKDGNSVKYHMIINMYYVRNTSAVQINHIYKALDTRTDKITEDTKVTVIDEMGEGKYGTWTKNEDGNFVSFTAKDMPKDGYTRTTADEDMITYDFGEGAILNVEYVREYRSRKPGGGGRSGGEDIPDGDVPLSDLPDDEVPLSDLPGGTDEEEMIPDDEVPLAELPITGGMGVGLFILAGGAIAAAGFGLRRREEEN